MFKVLPESEGHVLGVEVSRGYTKKDMQAFKEAFEQKIAQGHGRINLLVRLDKLDLSKVPVEHYIEDCRYALSQGENLGRIAVVGNSPMARAMVTADNLIMAGPKRGITERYFDLAELEQAWEFVRG
ncbi:MAG: STAS/SEC14 domain-containing protein [Proteobacteria bacterium]|nr:STAS/SEC14 domain-containing protein [Pseudomonadota bacterium]MBU1450334.1 STAS/SEC14 domain-containing protein [Pseudomonadota bacterium]MBU2470743.1 STAS/SEC14 domain-containing protein [Pseudomonadota bacterium]MBU2518470.1 STAS/SEC14 domain-containing protein [Pseudomonadota bacterium]